MKRSRNRDQARFTKRFDEELRKSEEILQRHRSLFMSLRKGRVMGLAGRDLLSSHFGRP